MTNTYIARLSSSDAPWTFALRLGTSVDAKVFSSVIDSLKLSIPARSRKWDAESKRWLFHADCIEAVESILDMHSVKFDYDDGDAHRCNYSMSREQAARELHLLPDAPSEVITAVYRALAKKFHPDHGGDLEKMQRLNRAVEVLQ